MTLRNTGNLPVTERVAERSYFTCALCSASWSLEGDVPEALCPNCPNRLVLRRPRRPIGGTRTEPRTKGIDAFVAEIRKRQDERRRMLLARQDALSRSLARYATEKRGPALKQQRRVDYRARVNEEVRLAEQHQAMLEAVHADASGELADLIREQERELRFGGRVRRSRLFVDISDHFQASQLGLVP